MNKFFILLFLIFSTKSERWYKEVNGHDINDDENGYSGLNHDPFTDFYLCSERKYKAHFKNLGWSEEFSACQPVGNGSEIDAIAIDGGLPYGGYSNGKWSKNVTKYDIDDDENGYVGSIGKGLNGIFIYGDEYYRNAFLYSDCTNEKNVSYRIINNFFGVEYSNFTHDNEIEVSLKENTKINITVKLLYPYQLSYKGKIIFKSKDYNVESDNGENIISNKLKMLLKNIIDFDFDKIEDIIKKGFSTRFMIFGDTFFNFKWRQNRIEIEAAAKIEEFKNNTAKVKPDYHGYRGGFIINIILDDKDTNLLSKITKICKIIVRYSGVKIQPSVKKLLSSDLKSFENVGEVIDSMGHFSIIAEKIIFLEIFSEIYIPKEED